MHPWISGILLPAATALFIGLVITPRLEARNKRVGLVHEARDEFSRRVLTILSASARLRATPIPETLTEQRPALAEKMTADRDRWVDQLDEATRYMIDNMETFGLSYPTERGRDLIGRFVTHSRAIVLSERTIEVKADRLASLAGPVQHIFFTRRWRLITIVRSFDEFDQALVALDEDLAEQVPTSL
ncbi:hypothetical protein [Streptomyces sp. NRRL S-920]|uniref:hypothetical protein n=1 Tax=Streptomyces sp. NRRL S-920 TaxID=1463921 RepID=UPI00068D8DFF|nr:hypothetical protein [Streptomyces sp. NRRL S-920]